MAGLADVAGNAGIGSSSVTWVMDTTWPVSKATAQTTSPLSKTITVNVAGSDPSSSMATSGIVRYDLYVRDLTTGGAYTLLANLTPAMTVATYQGQSSHTYGFLSLAVDAAGNLETKSFTLNDDLVALPDLDPPVTSILAPSDAQVATATFTLTARGTDTGTTDPASLAYIDFYVAVDSATTYTKTAHVLAGTPGAGGIYQVQTTYQAITDGASHRYRFYSVGIDKWGNVEAAPLDGGGNVVPDIDLTKAFAPPPSLMFTGLTVQNGLAERSFIQTVDVRFNQVSAAVAALAQDGSPVHLIRHNLDGSGGVEIPRTAYKLSVHDNVLNFYFGQNGLGGQARGNMSLTDYWNSLIAGDGYYEIAVDLNGNGGIESSEQLFFYRLLGDVDGNRAVDQTDLNIIAAPAGRYADVNGDGFVNVNDSLLANKSKGRQLKVGLRLDN